MTVERCRSCGAAVEWGLTKNGKRGIFDAGTETSHFATCPSAHLWRKRAAPAPSAPDAERSADDLRALQEQFGPPQPRTPQKSQPALLPAEDA